MGQTRVICIIFQHFLWFKDYDSILFIVYLRIDNGMHMKNESHNKFLLTIVDAGDITDMNPPTWWDSRVEGLSPSSLVV